MADRDSNFYGVPFNSQDILTPNDNRDLDDILCIDEETVMSELNVFDPEASYGQHQAISDHPVFVGTPVQEYPVLISPGSAAEQEHCGTVGEVESSGRSPVGPPSQELFSGPLNFAVRVSPSNKCFYSEERNQIYVMPFTEFAVSYSWNGAAGMWVRACVVFLEPQHAGQRVQCCLSHRRNDGPEEMRHNVLVSARELGAFDVSYHGHPSTCDTWYSTLVHFPNQDSPRTHAYKFACTNNCSSEGITRRSIGILFTLEDNMGVVVGRQMVRAKASKCPLRDLQKDVPDAAPRGKRRAPPKPAKRVKRERLDPDLPLPVLALPQQVSVVGPLVLVAGLEMMLRMSEQRSASVAPDPALQDSIASLRLQIHVLKQQYAID